MDQKGTQRLKKDPRNITKPVKSNGHKKLQFMTSISLTRLLLGGSTKINLKQPGNQTPESKAQRDVITSTVGFLTPLPSLSNHCNACSRPALLGRRLSQVCRPCYRSSLGLSEAWVAPRREHPHPRMTHYLKLVSTGVTVGQPAT